MTTRSTASSSRTTVYIPREDQDVYLYSLRIAVLDHVISSSSSSSSNTASASGSTSTTKLVRSNTTTTASSLARPSLRHSVTNSIKPQDGWTNALLSLADTFKDPSSSSSGLRDNKSSRFPKEFVKVLDNKMERVAKGADPKHQDQLLRQTIGAFYGTYAQSSFQKNLRENRQIEEVILMFVTTASAILKKRLGSEGEDWKRELNHQVGQFVGIIRDGLKSCSRVPGELVNRLDSYLKKLAEPPQNLPNSAPTTTTTPNHDRHLSVTSSISTSTSSAYPSYSPSLQSSASPAFNSPAPSSSNRNSALLDPSPTTTSVNLAEMPFVQALGKVFGKSESEVKRDVQNLKRICTEQAAFNDLKLMINTVAALSSSSTSNQASSSSSTSPPPPNSTPNDRSSASLRPPSNRNLSISPYPFDASDFESPEAFASWKKQETDEVQELLLEMTVRNPDLVKNGIKGGVLIAGSEETNGRMNRRSSRNPTPGERDSLVIVDSKGEQSYEPLTAEDHDEGQDGGPFEAEESRLTFLPPDPTFFFRRLYEVLLHHDYSLMSSLPPDEDVSLSILSPLHETFLLLVRKRWRVPVTLKAATFVGLVAGLYKGMGVPEECVGEALEEVERVEEKWRYWRWPLVDRQILFRALSLLFDTLLTRFFEIFQGLLQQPFSSLLPHLDSISTNPVFLGSIGSNLSATLRELETGMRKFVTMAWEEKVLEFEMGREEGESEVGAWIRVLAWVRDEVKGFDSCFPEKVCGQLDPPALFLSVAAPLFVDHLNNSRISNISASVELVQPRATGGVTDGELLELYHGVKELRDMFQAFCPEEPLEIDFSAWFEPYVRKWLAMTDTQTSEWVNRAIAKDAFEPEETATHSSSIVDLIESCKAPVEFILSLKWPDEFGHAKFLTGLSRTIAKSIEQYSNQLESMFIDEMFPRKPEEALDQDVARPSAWLTKAKMVVQGDKKVEPFEFKAASCIKLNNIQAARKLLDTLYNNLDADKVSRIVELNTPPPPPSAPPTQPRYLFTVKIVLCENLSPPSGNSRSKKLDPFLILSDPAGYRVAKTRTLYDTNDPRWDETLDVSVKGDLWLRATVYNRNLVDHHDHVGCAYIHLDPRKFSDFLAKDVWFRLEDQNRQPLDARLLLRISMEGEKDDIRFYFGRAFRSLKRAEGDMMSPFVRHYISHSNLKSLLNTSRYNLPDLDRVRGNLDKGVRNLNAYVRDALASSTNSATGTLMIPPVHDPNAPSTVTLERLEQKKKGKGPLTDIEIENAIGDLLDYFEVTFATLKESLTPDAWHLVSLRLWKEILTTIEGLLVPPLSDRPTEMRPLSEKEVDVVYKWLGFLVNFFHGGGEGVPLEDLRNAKYLELIEARMYYEWSPDDLMRASVETMQRHFLTKSDSILSRSKSVYSQRNLGTIRARKIEKKQQATSSGEMILRILRMYPGTTDFLSTQLSTMQRLSVEQAQRQQLKSQRGSLQRSSGGGGGVNRLGRSSKAFGAQQLSTILDR
ncbi:uncharacterized protein JCM6883_000082 [Sporobolomyces salmoneus]|uniref:uncharacterized protein n=1 Tax=Sporobolomyces salmoneus TaxID=183962 RepID=UPI00317280E0